MDLAIYIYRRIQDNVEDFMQRFVDHEEFGRRNVALWDEARASGEEDGVRRLWREDHPMVNR